MWRAKSALSAKWSSVRRKHAVGEGERAVGEGERAVGEEEVIVGSRTRSCACQEDGSAGTTQGAPTHHSVSGHMGRPRQAGSDFLIYARYARGADNLVDSVGDPFPRSV